MIKPLLGKITGRGEFFMGRGLFYAYVFRSVVVDGSVELFRSPDGQAEVCSVMP